eukprot:562581_1
MIKYPNVTLHLLIPQHLDNLYICMTQLQIELYMNQKLDYFAEYVASRYKDAMEQYTISMETFYDNCDEQALFRSGFEPNDLNPTKITETLIDDWYFTSSQLLQNAQSYNVFQTPLDSHSDHKIYVQHHTDSCWFFYNLSRRSRAHWLICNPTTIQKQVDKWETYKDKRQKQDAKKQWNGPPIPLKHLNIILSLFNYHCIQILN